MKTIIHSNGSKWAGQEPDTIEKLINILAKETIEERFFEAFSIQNCETGKLEWFNQCPIDALKNRNTMFFGNFEALSHVFRIETNDPVLIEQLTKAIKNNKGWQLYYAKNLVNKPN